MNLTISSFEIVRFAFQSSVPMPKQIESMKTLDNWADRQPGFICQQSHHDPGRRTDVVEWKTGRRQGEMERSQQDASLATIGDSAVLIYSLIIAGAITAAIGNRRRTVQKPQGSPC